MFIDGFTDLLVHLHITDVYKCRYIIFNFDAVLLRWR